MVFRGTLERGIDAPLQLVSRQQACRFQHAPLAMHPDWLNRIQPRASRRQIAQNDPSPDRLSHFDVLIVVTDPGTHGFAPMPGRIIPHQQQGRFPLYRR